MEHLGNFHMKLGFFVAGSAIFIFVILARRIFERLSPRIGRLLPKPFLGEGSNMEWAEEKRRELEASGRKVEFEYQNSEPPGHATGGRSMRNPSDGPLDDYLIVRASTRPLHSTKHEGLLQSWPDRTVHSDDAWADRVLRGREITGGL